MSYADGEIRIRLHAWCGHKDIYLKVKLGTKNSISFVYYGTENFPRELSSDEADTLRKLITGINLDFLQSDVNVRQLILPVIPTVLELKSINLKATFEWTNGDLATSPSSYATLERLRTYIEELLPINADGFDMPVYL